MELWVTDIDVGKLDSFAGDGILGSSWGEELDTDSRALRAFESSQLDTGIGEAYFRAV